jgi:hypothetical protein
MVSVHRMPVSVMYVVDVFAMGFSGMPAGLVVGVVMRLGRSVHTLQGALVIVVGMRPVSVVVMQVVDMVAVPHAGMSARVGVLMTVFGVRAMFGSRRHDRFSFTRIASCADHRHPR